MATPIISLLLLILDVYVIYLIVISGRDIGMKLVWIIVVLVLPLIGPILYLLSERSRHINGQVIRIAGKNLSLMCHPANRAPLLDEQHGNKLWRRPPSPSVTVSAQLPSWAKKV